MTWQPSELEDVPTTSYRVEKREASKTQWDTLGSVDSSQTSFLVPKLKPDIDYYFRVIAENAAGPSQPLVLERSYIPKRLYSECTGFLIQFLLINNHSIKVNTATFPHVLIAAKPSIPCGPLEVVDVTNDTITLSWYPPITDGGAALSAYIVEKREMMKAINWQRIARIKPHICTYTVTNLTAGRDYSFRVCAENIEGVSEPLHLEGSVAPTRPRSML